MVLVDVNDVVPINAATKKSTFIEELDKRLSQILQSNEMNDYDKSKMYLETFQKYLFFMHREKSDEKKKWGEINKNINQLTQTVLSRPRNFIRRADILPQQRPAKKLRVSPIDTAGEEITTGGNHKPQTSLVSNPVKETNSVSDLNLVREPQSVPIPPSDNRQSESQVRLIQRSCSSSEADSKKEVERTGIFDWFTASIKTEKQ